MKGRRMWNAVAATLLLAAGPGNARALDLASALREVEAANPTLAGRRELIEAARHRVAPAGAWMAPMLEVGAINVPTRGGFDAEPMTMKMIGLAQSVPVFGANGLRRRSAGADVAAEAAGYDGARYELAALAWEAYADAYYAGELADLGHAHRDHMDQLVSAARARYEAGRGRLDDLLRTEAARGRTLVEEAGFRAEAEGARARLAAWMGRPSAVLEDALEPLPAAAPALPADSLVTLVTADHPRLRELEARVESDRFAARAARRTQWPDLELGVSYGFREPIAGVEQADMWSARLGVRLPIFAGQRERAEGAALDARARAAESDLRAARLDLAREARRLAAVAVADRRTVALLADTVVAVQERALAAAWSAYTAGSADLGRVLEATHDVYEQRVALVRARQDLARTEARLFAVLARDDRFGLLEPAPGRRER